MIKKKRLIKKLEGKYVRVSSEWVKDNDKILFDFIEDKLREYVIDKDNSASKEDLNSFQEGNYWIDIKFSDNGVSYSAGRDIQNINNQPNWGEDDYKYIEVKVLERKLRELGGKKQNFFFCLSVDFKN